MIAGPRVLLIPDVVLIRRRARCTVDAILVLDLLGLNGSPDSAGTPSCDSLMIINTWRPFRCPPLFFMHPLPTALMPSGPRTSDQRCVSVRSVPDDARLFDERVRAGVVEELDEDTSVERVPAWLAGDRAAQQQEVPVDRRGA